MELSNLASVATFLTGVAALSAIVISILQIKKNSRISEANFWLTLRENFDTENRRAVHRDLRLANWKHAPPSEKSDWIKVEDYMGLLEICERMLDRKIIDKKMFKNLYEYRVYNI